MALFLPENQYNGVNAHLHSYLIRHGEWRGFHNAHITYIKEAMQRTLGLNSGYRVTAEKSLQIVWQESDPESSIRKSSVPDVSIHKNPQSISQLPKQSAPTATPTLTVPVNYTFRVPDEVVALAISRVQPDGERKLVTRIELLSPANKPPGSHAKEYLFKRSETLYSGVKVVELDYLHEQSPVVPNIPDYTTGAKISYPYMIIINDLQQTNIYGIRVDEPVPVINIPLDEDKVFALDMNAVYQTTYHADINYAGDIVDYEKLPQGIEKYTEDDQQRILRVMTRAKATAAQE